ncbi:hypothetical protein GZH46_00032 [Fragariocoptes setiger]|uniref:Uncharacterized protein n=1 Tax=Fragariocoptes setiger TaxID=1670756 RepID=A0ABQ7SD87_9ACAR|nr:hypothetical protein GZH46_00032 [Fragariocoptes setiger]
MSPLYTPVRIILVVFLGVNFVLAILSLLEAVQGNTKDTVVLVTSCIQIIIIIYGLAGAYYENRRHLMAFVLFMIIAIVVSVVQKQSITIWSNMTSAVVCILLALWQYQMLRGRGLELF